MLLIHGMSSSRRTWWRAGPDLEARGWAVETVDLAGHGGRPVGTTRSLAGLAHDVVARRPSGCTLVVGHSLGAIVALHIVSTWPTYARGVVLEDPPATGGNRRAPSVVDDVGREVDAARADPGGAIDALLRGHPTWSRRDARSVLEGRLLTDPAMSRPAPGDLAWDLATLVAQSPVPVALVAAVGGYSALTGPGREAVLRLLPPERVTELPGSHHVHLDQPTRWADAVESFGAALRSAQ